jgi:hypothetical protein
LTGTPTPNNSRFNVTTGQLAPAGNAVDSSTRLARTREVVAGVQHELIPNLAVGVDYVYRRYDRGTAAYIAGYQPGAAGFPVSQVYFGPRYYTDPVTGFSAPYYQVCSGCVRPSGIGTITMTNLAYQTYQAVIPTLTKRFSNRWQLNASATLQTNPSYLPLGSYTNPTGVEFSNGRSTGPRYLVKVSGTYALDWGTTVSGNLNVTDGGARLLNITGPSNVYGGVTSTGATASTLTYGTLAFQPAGTTRFQPTSLLDLGVHKVFAFRGGRNSIKAMFDAFNVFNVNTVLSYATNTLSSASFNNPTAIVPSRVFRVGALLMF